MRQGCLQCCGGGRYSTAGLTCRVCSPPCLCLCLCLRRLLAQSPLLQELELSGCERLTPNSLATAVHPCECGGSRWAAEEGRC